MSAASAATWMGAIAAIGLVVDALEVLVARAAYTEGGIYSFALLRSGQRFFVRGPGVRPFGGLLGYPGVLTLPLVQLAAAAELLTLPLQDATTQRWAGAAACAVALGARMLFYARNVFGQDGSDQMLLVVLSAACAAHLAGSAPAATVFVLYAAGQLVLAYGTSGIAKAISPTWRSGRAIPGITRTIGYGSPRLGTWLEAQPLVARLLCWSVIVFECGAPLLLLGGRDGALALIALGLCFHVGVALTMGLNVFLWSFAATYPAVLLLGDRIGGLIGG